MEAETRPLAPGRLARAVVRLLAPPEERAAILEDLAEETAQVEAREGRRRAARFLRWQIAHSTPPWLRRRLGQFVFDVRRHGAMTLRGLGSDVRIATRRLLKAPGFTALSVATLAIGIGAVATAFSFAHALWLKPLPYLDPDRLVWLHARHEPTGTTAALSGLEVSEYSRGLGSLASVAAFSYGAGIARTNGEPERIVAHRVSANLFRVLGVHPAIGRDFEDADAVGKARVVMLSDATWTKRFGRDPAIAARTLTLDGVSYAIAGIMPQGFAFPRVLEADIWVPADPGADVSGARAYQAVARLSPGASVDDGTRDIGARAKHIALTHPDTNRDWSASATPAGTTASPSGRLAFQLLLGIVFLFLLVACANLAGLLLARHAARRAEFAVCLSIGASRWRLARMLLVESLLLSGAGCAAGVLIAAYGSNALAAVMPPRTPGLDNVGLNVVVITVTAAASVLSAVLVGMLPALNLRPLRPAEALAGARTVVRATARAQRLLVVGEVAIAVMLVVGASAMLQSFGRLLDRDRGYDPGGLHALNVSLPFSDDSYLPTERRALAFADLIARVAAVPGVQSAGATTGFPGSPLGILGSTPIAQTGRPQLIAAVHSASADYFRTMGIPLKGGRAFTPADSTRAAPVAIVNETLAREFPNGTPIGRRIPISVFSQARSYEIVGVAGDIRLGEYVGYRVFVPLAQASPYWIDLVYRADPGATVMPAVRRALRAAGPDLLLENESSFQTIISNSVALQRAESAFAGIVGALATIVAGIGVYALVTFLVAQRRRDMGIRLALGSPPLRLFRDTFAGALRLIGAGVILGLLSAAALVRLAGSQVFGLTSAGLGVHAGAAALVVAVAVAATWVPARRAMRVDPLTALRPE